MFVILLAAVLACRADSVIYTDCLGYASAIICTTAGRSMEPAIHAGDSLLIVRCTAADLHVGDVAAWEDSHGVWRVHRVMEVRPDGVLFCGDNAKTDGWVKPVCVRGRVVQIFRRSI